MTGRRVLLVVGPSCAGKSTMGDHLAAAHGACHIEASEVLRRLLDEDHTPGTWYREPAGFDYVRIADRIVEMLAACGRGLVVVSGLRTLAELDRINARVRGAELVYVDADAGVRYRRCAKRDRADVAEHLVMFDDLDRHPAHTLLPAARQRAAVVIVNGGSMAGYLDAIDRLADSAEPARLAGQLADARRSTA